MGIQEIIAGAIVIAALAYVGHMVYKRSGLFGKRSGCQSDCGCSEKAKQPRIAA